MKRFLTKRNIYITLFAILYAVVALVSLIHSFSFFGLANNTGMSVMLGLAFEIGQAAVLFAILTSSKDRSRFMPWALMTLLTLVQIIGNVFSSYKYLMQHNVGDLQYFKEPIFVWTDLPENVTTVLVTYIVGAILPIVALCMTAMIANYLEDNSKESSEAEDKSKETTEDNEDIVEESNEIELDEPIEDESIEEVEDTVEEEHEDDTVKGKTHFVNV